MESISVAWPTLSLWGSHPSLSHQRGLDHLGRLGRIANGTTRPWAAPSHNLSILSGLAGVSRLSDIRLSVRRRFKPARISARGTSQANQPASKRQSWGDPRSRFSRSDSAYGDSVTRHSAPKYRRPRRRISRGRFVFS